MECPFEPNSAATKPGAEKRVVSTNNDAQEDEMVVNRAFPIIKDEKVFRPVPSLSTIAFQQNKPSSQENSFNSVSFNKSLQTGRKDNIPIILQRHSKCPYLGRNVIDHPSDPIAKSTNSNENHNHLDFTNSSLNNSEELLSRELSKPNGTRVLMNKPLLNTDNAILNSVQNSISESHSSSNDLMQKRSLECKSSSSTSGAVASYTNASSSPTVCKIKSNVAQSISPNQALIGQTIDCPFSIQSSSSFHVSKNVRHLPKYNHRPSLNKKTAPRSRQTSTTSTISNSSIRSRLSMNEVLESIKQDETSSGVNYKDSGISSKKFSKLSFSESVDEVSVDTKGPPNGSEFEDTFEEEVSSSSFKRHRRTGRSRIRSRGKHGSLQSRKQDASSTTETIVPAPENTNTESSLPNQATETIIPDNPVVNPCPFTSVISEDYKRKLALKEFDEKVRKSSPSVDKALITRSGYHQSLLRVSWNLIESEILHSPDNFDLGYDIQQYFALHQNLFLEDLARTNSRHTLNGLMRVVSKVLKHLSDLSEVDDYLRFVGRIHDCAGVDPRFLNLTGLVFCQALDQLGHHTDIWNREVKDTWQTFFRVIVRIMKKGYSRQHPGAAIVFVGKGGIVHRSIVPKPLVIDQKNLITEVWVMFQDNIIHYLSNSLLLPLVIRSNRTISKYFLGYDSTISCLSFDGSEGVGTLGKTKHASWFLTSVLGKVIPNLENLESVEEYLETLGRRHAKAGVRIEHLDLLALVYCSAVRAVVANQGVRGGPLFETTRAWFNFLRVIVSVMKRGYDEPQDVVEEDGCSDMDEEDLAKLTATQKLQEGNNRLMARRRCRIDFERSVSGDGNSSAILSNDLSRLIEQDSNEIKEEEEDTETEVQGGKEGKLRGSLSTLSQSPIMTGLINDPGAGLFKRRNAFWKVDSSRAGSVPDVPETKKLMAFPLTVNDNSSSISINNQNNTPKNFNIANKSKLSIHNRSEGKWSDSRDHKNSSGNQKKEKNSLSGVCSKKLEGLSGRMRQFSVQF